MVPAFGARVRALLRLHALLALPELAIKLAKEMFCGAIFCP